VVLEEVDVVVVDVEVVVVEVLVEVVVVAPFTHHWAVDSSYTSHMLAVLS